MRIACAYNDARGQADASCSSGLSERVNPWDQRESGFRTAQVRFLGGLVSANSTGGLARRSCGPVDARLAPWEAYAKLLAIIRRFLNTRATSYWLILSRGPGADRYQATAFLMSSRILASVVSSNEVRVHATGCILASSSRAGFTTSPKPNAMNCLSGLM